MKFLTLLLFFLFSLNMLGQTSLDWLTYYGVQSNNYSSTRPMHILYDSINNYIYVAGATSDTLGIATPGAHQETFFDAENNPDYAKRDMFLSKWDASGNLIWSTYYGSNSEDNVHNMVLDTNGNIILTGTNQGHTNITTPGAFQEFTVWEPGDTNPNNFLAKFSPDGILLWSTYFGLGGNTLYSGLTIDPATNDIYMAGTATYPELGTAGTFQPDYFGGITDGFIAKFDASGNRLWCTYLGGENSEHVSNITLSQQGYLYVCGSTRSGTNIASPGAEIDTHDTTMDYSIGFLAKFDTSGNRIWSTYLGGNGIFDRFSDIKTTTHELTGEENVFIYGRAGSTDLGTSGTYSPSYGGEQFDLILLKYNQLGQKQWGTYIGGNGRDLNYVNGLNTMVGFTNSLIVTGSYGSEELQIAGGTDSTDFYFDTNECGYTPHTGNKKGFVASLDTTGNLNWSKPFDEGINSISPIGNNNFYITGFTNIDGLATSGAYKETKELGSVSGFIGKINFDHCLHDEFSIIEVDNVLYAPFNFSGYQWVKDGIELPDATHVYWELNDSEPAVYTVTFKDDCNCSYITSEYSSNPMGVDDPDRNNTVLVFPNPADDVIQITNLKNKTSVAIYNLIGQLVYSKTSASPRETITVSYLSSGMYILRLSVEEQNVTFVKFTKK